MVAFLVPHGGHRWEPEHDDGCALPATLLALPGGSVGLRLGPHRPGAPQRWLPLGLAWLNTAVFAVPLLISLVDARAGLYALFLLFVAGPIEARSFDRALTRTRTT